MPNLEFTGVTLQNGTTCMRSREHRLQTALHTQTDPRAPLKCSAHAHCCAGGRAIFASGSPCNDVEYEGRIISSSQGELCLYMQSTLPSSACLLPLPFLYPMFQVVSHWHLPFDRTCSNVTDGHRWEFDRAPSCQLRLCPFLQQTISTSSPAWRWVLTSEQQRCTPQLLPSPFKSRC